MFEISEVEKKLRILIMISNWKIISNCCLPAFLREMLVNYASNMIRIRLNNCTIYWKQREFLLGLDNLQYLLSVGAIRRFIFSFFANQNFSRDRKAQLLCNSSTSSEISFHELPSKSKRLSIRKQIASLLSSQLIVSLFLRSSHLQRDI